MGKRVHRWEMVAELCRRYGLVRGAELGVKEGRFTANLLSSVPEIVELIAVDLFTDPRNGNALEDYKDWDWGAIVRQFREKTAPFLEAGRLTVFQCSTLEASTMVEDGELGFVFIDADHTTEGVIRDIRAWEPKIRPGGLIIGHDILFPSVRTAVERVFGENYTERHQGDDIWWVEKGVPCVGL